MANIPERNEHKNLLFYFYFMAYKACIRTVPCEDSLDDGWMVGGFVGCWNARIVVLVYSFIIRKLHFPCVRALESAVSVYFICIKTTGKVE